MRGRVRCDDIGDVRYTVPLVGLRITYATTREVLADKLTHTGALQGRQKTKQWQNMDIHVCVQFCRNLNVFLHTEPNIHEHHTVHTERLSLKYALEI